MFEENVNRVMCYGFFFSPSRAVLSAILRDEYLTLAVRTKEEGLSVFLIVQL